MLGYSGEILPIQRIRYDNEHGIWIYAIDCWDWLSDWFEGINQEGQLLFDFMYD